MIKAILDKLNFVNRLDLKLSEEIATKAAIGARAALAEVPLLDDLLDGKPVELVMTIQLKRKV